MPAPNLQYPHIEERLVWLRAHGASAQYQRQGLRRLAKAAKQLLEEKGGGTIDSYVASLYTRGNRQPIELAVLLGSGAVPPKLPGLGIPLAAEFLKNLGYDVAKPDRHVCRAVGAFGWVKFKNWADDSGNKAPYPSEKEMIQAMRSLDSLADDIGKPTIYVDNALWLLCAKSGLWATNEELRRLASKRETSRRGPEDATAIDPSRADRYTWQTGDVVYVSKEESDRMLDEMYGKGNRPGVSGFMG